MCQLPFIRMCVCSTSPPENIISRCLPRELTETMVRPTTGVSTSTLVSSG
jgi:hypothetical protein